MTKFILLFYCAVSVAWAAVDLNKPIPKLVLKDGRQLENVVIVSYSPSAIMAKWEGGRGTIPYEALPLEIGEAVKSMRPKSAAPSRQDPPKVTPRPEAVKQSASKERTISGQVFVTTRGAGAYRFSGATVIAYPASQLSAVLEKVRSELANAATARLSSQRAPDDEWLLAWIKSAREIGLQSVASAKTNADGEYALNITSPEEIFLFCYTTRQVGRGTEQNRWIVPVGSSQKLDLNTSNQF